MHSISAKSQRIVIFFAIIIRKTPLFRLKGLQIGPTLRSKRINTTQFGTSGFIRYDPTPFHEDTYIGMSVKRRLSNSVELSIYH